MPSLLSPILGQPYAVRVLEQALASSRLSGAYLFVGPDGVGKATTARQFAKMLCGANDDNSPISRAVDAGTFPDVRETVPGGKSQTYRIAQLWPRADAGKEFPPEQAVLRDLDFAPINGPRRVFILQNAEAFNDASGNSILKTLEEPPPYAVFILTAASLGAVLPTIVSRCQVVRFAPLPAAAIELALTERFGVDAVPARFLASYCEGRLGRAVSLARSPSLLAAREQFLDWARDAATAPPVKAFKLGEELRKLAPKLRVEDADAAGEEKSLREPLSRALELLAVYWRDLLAVRVSGEGAALVNSDRRAEIAGAAARLSPLQLETALSLIVGIRGVVERNGNAQVATDVLLAQLTATH